MSASVAIFWDYENCALPALEPSYAIVNSIRRLAHQFGSVKSFKAYLEYPEPSSLKSLALRSELQSCGVSLIDCPHNGRKEVADKMMMIDMMAYAIDTPAPATIILISGDRDFVYAVSVLALRQYQVVVLAPRAAHSSLKAQASAVYHWPDQFLPDLPPSSSSPTPPATRVRRPSNGNIPVVDWKGQCPTPSLTTSSDPSWDGVSSEGENEHGRPTTRTRDRENLTNMEDNDNGDESESSSGEQLLSQSPVDSDLVPDIDKGSPVMDGYDASVGAHGQFEGLSPSNPRAAPSMSWASVAHLHLSDQRHAPNSALPRHLSTTATEGPTPNLNYSTVARPPGLSAPALRAAAPPFVFGSTAFPAQSADDPPADTQPHPASTNAAEPETPGEDWQTYTRAAKKRPFPFPSPTATLPAEFRPLVRVLKRQLAAGVAHVESSQLGQLLSQEAPPRGLGAVYERAGVARLKEYTARAAARGVVTLSREGADGHNYVALHPAYRRAAGAAV